MNKGEVRDGKGNRSWGTSEKSGDVPLPPVGTRVGVSVLRMQWFEAKILAASELPLVSLIGENQSGE